jgi:hypothetical protein
MKHYCFQIVLISLLALIAGCDSLARKPETIQEGLFVSSAYGEALTLSVNDARRSGSITRDQHYSMLDVLQSSHDAVQTGLDAFNAGNYREARSKLDMAESALRSVALVVERLGNE